MMYVKFNRNMLQNYYYTFHGFKMVDIMSVNWKICNECGRKVNEVAIECPYCSSNSFKKYIIDDSDVSSENDEIPKKENKNNGNEPLNKIKEGFDKFSNNTKKMGNDFLHENLPEDYADKVTENLSNISKNTNEFLSENEQIINIKKGISDFSDSTKRASVNFINDKISYDSQEKIKENAVNVSKSTKKFFGDATSVITNIHNHRKIKRDEKRAQKRKEKEEKKRKKDIERKEKQKQREKEREENRIKREKREKEQHEQTLKSLRQTKSTTIKLPVNNPHSKDMMGGAIQGQMMGAGLGMAIDGLKGSESLSHTANSGLTWGGAGAVIGGLAAASDDGIKWVSEQLIIGDSELIVPGKFVVPYSQIKLISIGKYKFRDLIIITLPTQGIRFSHDDVNALKTVIDENIAVYREKIR